jgi:hypothetical protein
MENIKELLTTAREICRLYHNYRHYTFSTGIQYSAENTNLSFSSVYCGSRRLGTCVARGGLGRIDVSPVSSILAGMIFAELRPETLGHEFDEVMRLHLRLEEVFPQLRVYPGVKLAYPSVVFVSTPVQKKFWEKIKELFVNEDWSLSRNTLIIDHRVDAQTLGAFLWKTGING